MTLFNAGGHDAADSNAVATHDHHLRLAVLIQIAGVHGLAVLGAELEDVADFDAALDGERAIAIGTDVAFAYLANVGAAVVAALAAPIGVHEVLAVTVGAAHEVHQVHHTVICYDGYLEANRADAAWQAAKHRLNLAVLCHGEG